jgi:hypothetical protein
MTPQETVWGNIRKGLWILAIWATILGAALAWGVRDFMEPDCPREDSCTADYRDGEWHIEEVRP